MQPRDKNGRFLAYPEGKLIMPERDSKGRFLKKDILIEHTQLKEVCDKKAKERIEEVRKENELIRLMTIPRKKEHTREKLLSIADIHHAFIAGVQSKSNYELPSTLWKRYARSKNIITE